ncbi:MAG TPA: NAD-dependent epimerase/dehydratase family protein [Patescibacteria group bacterium]|nr:NAD-dependent epimerase/dehydratase family protein [Patescibacteria group bacterium]
MKVLITGGAGFIGSHVVETLLGTGHLPVVLDNLSSGRRENLGADIRVVVMDILDPELEMFFQRERFDAVIHLAAQTSVPYSLERPDVDCRINLQGLIQVLEACRKTGVKRVLFPSSAAVYGDVAELPVSENSPASPGSFYGLTKLTSEKYLALYQEIYGLEYAVMRYANVYGERQGDGGEGGVVSIFARKLRRGETVTVFGDGGQTRDFIYVGDVAKANLQALLAPTEKINRVLNISTRMQTSVTELLRVMQQVTGKTTEVVFSSPREGDIYHSMLDNRAAVAALDWQPQTGLDEGLAQTCRYWE